MFSNSKHTGFLPQGPAVPLHKTCLSGLMSSNRGDATSAFPFDFIFLFCLPLLEKPTGFFPLGVVRERRALDCLVL